MRWDEVGCSHSVLDEARQDEMRQYEMREWSFFRGGTQ